MTSNTLQETAKVLFTTTVLNILHTFIDFPTPYSWLLPLLLWVVCVIVGAVKTLDEFKRRDEIKQKRQKTYEDIFKNIDK